MIWTLKPYHREFQMFFSLSFSVRSIQYLNIPISVLQSTAPAPRTPCESRGVQAPHPRWCGADGAAVPQRPAADAWDPSVRADVGRDPAGG